MKAEFDREVETALTVAKTESEAVADAVDRLAELLDQAEAEIAADVLRMIWGQNPQAPVEQLRVEYVLDRIASRYGRETTEAVIEAARWDIEYEEAESS